MVRPVAFDIVFDLVMRDLGDVVPVGSKFRGKEAVRAAQQSQRQPGRWSQCFGRREQNRAASINHARGKSPDVPIERNQARIASWSKLKIIYRLIGAGKLCDESDD